MIHDVIVNWAGDATVAADDNTQYFSARVESALEGFAGKPYSFGGGPTQAANANQYWQPIFSEPKARFFVQGALAEVFTASYYDFASDEIVLGGTLNDILSRAGTDAPADAQQEAAYWSEIGQILTDRTGQLGKTEAEVQTALETEAGGEVIVYDSFVWAETGGMQLYGLDGKDQMLGSAGGDTFYASHDDDRLDGLGGDDELRGEDGADTILGGAGHDELRGGDGADTLQGGTGDDELDGDQGNDLLQGGAGQDSLYGDDGHDTLEGNDGNDRLYGYFGDDKLTGGSGDDTLEGGKGDDLVQGGAGDDRINDDDGADTLIGGAGDDYIKLDRYENDANVLVYESVADSTDQNGQSGDFIRYFEVGRDTIDLSTLGYQGMSDLVITANYDTAITSTQGDDFVLTIDGTPALSASDFVFDT
jgi:Ca2+-binding RTX toxin-like protein